MRQRRKKIPIKSLLFIWLPLWATRVEHRWELSKKVHRMCLSLEKTLRQESRETPTYGMLATGQSVFIPDVLKSVGPEGVAWRTMDSSYICIMEDPEPLGGQGGLPEGSDP